MASDVQDEEGVISVAGFGSLLSESSARSTFPDLRNFRAGKAFQEREHEFKLVTVQTWTLGNVLLPSLSLVYYRNNFVNRHCTVSPYYKPRSEYDDLLMHLSTSVQQEVHMLQAIINRHEGGFIPKDDHLFQAVAQSECSNTPA